MKQFFYSVISLSVAVWITLFHCTTQSTGVETTNGAKVFVYNDKVDGTSPPFSFVYLFDQDYIPFIDSGLGIATVTGNDGTFSFTGISVDTVSVTIVNNDYSMAAVVHRGMKGFSYEKKLDGHGSLAGEVISVDTGRILVFLRGTGYYALLNGPGEFSFKSLPPGIYTVQAARLKMGVPGGKAQIEILSTFTDVTIYSGKEVRIPALVIP